jgi:hypothetical protein
MNMDFKKLISHIESIDGPIETPKAPELAAPIRLDEDTELRVLAGVTALTESVVMEKAVSKSQQQAAGAALAAKRGDGKAVGASKEMMKMSTKELEKIAGTKHKGLPDKKTDESVEEGFDADAKVGDKKKTQHGTLTKTATGVKHERGYTKEKDEDDDAPKAKKAKKESVDPEAFKAKFSKMVEAKKGAKPDFLDVDKDGDKKEPMKKAVADKKKGAVGKEVKEAEEKRAPAKKSEREVTLPSGAKTKATKVQGWQSQKADKEATKEKNESVSKSKKVVAESVEQKLSFKDMMKIVVESGGQQQIDPVDTALFDWATRVAKQKLGEGMKAEVYAGMVYERMGGRFEMYDVLSEDTK